jgi:thiol-disulfide isomerase/thioredoxin
MTANRRNLRAELLIAALFAAPFFASCGWRATDVPPIERLEFSAVDLSGATVTHEDARFKGKVVLVDFWGTWCPPCVEAIPHLVEFDREYRDRGLEIVGIAFEAEPPERARIALADFAEAREMEYLILYGGQGDLQAPLRVAPNLPKFKGYPTTVLIGRDGRVRRIDVGFDRAMRRTIEELLAENP